MENNASETLADLAINWAVGQIPKEEHLEKQSRIVRRTVGLLDAPEIRPHIP